MDDIENDLEVSFATRSGFNNMNLQTRESLPHMTFEVQDVFFYNFKMRFEQKVVFQAPFFAGAWFAFVEATCWKYTSMKVEICFSASFWKKQTSF